MSAERRYRLARTLTMTGLTLAMLTAESAGLVTFAGAALALGGVTLYRFDR